MKIHEGSSIGDEDANEDFNFVNMVKSQELGHRLTAGKRGSSHLVDKFNI